MANIPWKFAQLLRHTYLSGFHDAQKIPAGDPSIGPDHYAEHEFPDKLIDPVIAAFSETDENG